MSKQNESNIKKSYKGMAMEGFIARWYAKNTKSNLDQYKDFAKKVAENVTEGSDILEVAPGPGYLSIELMKMGNYHVTGLDISKTFVEIASKNAKEEGIKVNFIEGDASNMPFDNKTFDFIVCTAAFKNFTKPIMAINEMYRVLKPNGKALIIDLRRDASKDAINDNIKDMDMNWINSLFTKLTFRTFLLRNAYTISEIKNLVSKTNFQEYKIPNNPMEFELWLEK
ncbi:class I SAM-dependent methyltransferase [Methanobacterium sp.]|uniref:class I SAM-dependent methyltransferase n=1 Tax=Methanobacterium sp. TaxID=2164 RepID=UPI003C77E6B8